MEKEYSEMFGNITQAVWHVMDIGKDMGYLREIAFPGGEDDIRERIRLDMIYFVLRALDHDDSLAQEAIDFMNECFQADLEMEDYERLRNIATGDDMSDLFVLFPRLIKMDQLMGSLLHVSISKLYVDCAENMAKGVFKTKASHTISDIMGISRLCGGCVAIIEKATGESFHCDPLHNMTGEAKGIVDACVDFDKRTGIKDALVEYLEDLVLRGGEKEKADPISEREKVTADDEETGTEEKDTGTEDTTEEEIPVIGIDDIEEQMDLELSNMLIVLYSVADSLDEGGTSNLLAFTDEEGMHGLMKKSLLMLTLRSIPKRRKLKQSMVNYLNEALGLELSFDEMDDQRVIARSDDYEKICDMLALFTRNDMDFHHEDMKEMPVMRFYILALCFLVSGIISLKEYSGMNDLGWYYSIISGLIKTVEEFAGKRLGIAPADFVDEDIRPCIMRALQRNCPDPLSDHFAEVLKKENFTVFQDIEDYSELALQIKKKKAKERKSMAEKQKSARSKDKEDPIKELDRLVGLEDVKKRIHDMLNLQIVRKRCADEGIERAPISMHMAFIGNPGTGKTTVARIIGEIYKEAGILSKGHLVEVGQADIVGKYVGYTAAMVKDVFAKAKGGVLFIDEAYSLVNDENGGYGQEAIDTLIKLMEDKREDTIVIVAGYPALMRTFLDSNPGLRSRIPFEITFPDYSAEELLDIFQSYCKENGIQLKPRMKTAIRRIMEEETDKKKRNFANARIARNLFEQMILNQANRLVASGNMEREELCSFAPADIPRKRVLISIPVREAKVSAITELV